MRLKVNYQNRIWLGTTKDNVTKVKPDTILKIKNSSGDKEEIFAEDCRIFKSYR